jgi:hypothetical protein
MQKLIKISLISLIITLSATASMNDIQNMVQENKKNISKKNTPKTNEPIKLVFNKSENKGLFSF